MILILQVNNVDADGHCSLYTPLFILLCNGLKAWSSNVMLQLGNMKECDSAETKKKRISCEITKKIIIMKSSSKDYSFAHISKLNVSTSFISWQSSQQISQWLRKVSWISSLHSFFSFVRERTSSALIPTLVHYRRPWFSELKALINVIHLGQLTPAWF